MNADYRRGGLVWPFVLVGLGLVILLNNVGVLDLDLWEVVFRLWPVLLVAAGIDLLVGRRSFWGSVIALLLIAGVFAASLWMLSTGTVVGASPGHSIRQPLQGATSAEVSLAPALGRIQVGAGTDGETLIEGSVREDRRDGLEPNFRVAAGRAEFSLETGSRSFSPFFWPGRESWDLLLSPDVPLHLSLRLGVGEADLQLNGLTLERLEVDIGVGRGLLVLPAAGDFSAEVRGGVGETVVVIPRGLGARLRIDRGLAALELPSEFRQEGEAYVSPEYRTAEHRVSLDLNQGVGRIIVRLE